MLVIFSERVQVQCDSCRLVYTSVATLVMLGYVSVATLVTFEKYNS